MSDTQRLDAMHAQLQKVLQKYYGDALAPAERTALEQQMQNFQQQPYAVSAAQSFLQRSSDRLVLFFAASLLEKYVLEKWRSTDTAAAETLRTSILQLLVARTQSENPWPKMVLDKILGTVCLIAMQDFPQRYPSYFGDLLKLVQAAPTLEVGARLVRFTLEEFPLSSTKLVKKRHAAVLSSQRMDELTAFMNKTVGQFIPVLEAILVDEAREARAGADALTCLEVICDNAPASAAAGIAASSKLLRRLFGYLIPVSTPMAAGVANGNTGAMKLSPHAPLALQVLSSMITKQCLPTAGEQGFAAFVAKQVSWWFCVGHGEKLKLSEPCLTFVLLS